MKQWKQLLFYRLPQNRTVALACVRTFMYRLRYKLGMMIDAIKSCIFDISQVTLTLIQVRRSPRKPSQNVSAGNLKMLSIDLDGNLSAAEACWQTS